MTLTYRSGGWLVAADARALVAVLPTPQLTAEDLLARVWPAVEAGADLTGLLEALLADGWARAPHFVLVQRPPEQQVAVVVRGPARVVGQVGGRQVDLTAEGVLTWVEQRVDAVSAVHLPAPGAGTVAAGPALPLRAGAVMASAVLWAERGGPSGGQEQHRTEHDDDETVHASSRAASGAQFPTAVTGPGRVPSASGAAAFDDDDQLTVIASGAAGLGQRGTQAHLDLAEQETQVTVLPARSWLLRTSDGKEVAVSGRVLVGRDPRAEGDAAGSEAPQLVAVESPTGDVSRTHLELLVDERGALLARDLESTNGTFVLAGGALPAALPRGTSAEVPEGAVLDLGDGVTLTVTRRG